MLAHRSGLIAICSNGALHQGTAASALQAGLRRHGIEARIVSSVYSLPPEPIVACWGWRNGVVAQQAGRQVLLMERGYIDDRFKWTSLGWNGLNGRAEFICPDDPSRWEQHFAPLMRPWKEGGSYLLVMGQVPGDAACRTIDFLGWARRTVKALTETQPLPVYYRPHPHYTAGAQDPKPAMKGALADALADAAAVITWNSNSGVDAVMAGVPTVALDEGSMAYPVAGHTLQAIDSRPDRSAWAQRIAWCQWSLAEIARGAAWEIVGQNFEARLERERA